MVFFKSMPRIVITAISILLVHSLIAQDLTRRYSFAQSYFGLDLNFVSNYGQSSFLNEAGQVQSFQRNSYLNPAINIGATHFWGYADIYVSIQTGRINDSDDAVKTNSNFGVFTGFRVYPVKMRENSLRPFVGYKFSPITYSQDNLDGETFEKTQTKSVLDIGLGYQSASMYIYFGYNRMIQSSTNVYISRTESTQTNLPRDFLNLGVNLTIETTERTNTESSRFLNKEFSQSNKKGMYLAIGPSSGFQVGSSNYFTDLYPFLDNKRMARIFPDFALGYHFTKSDLTLSINYRPIIQDREAFGFHQSLQRKSLSLEINKYFGDYQGFVPFIGVGTGFETIQLTEIDNGIEISNFNRRKLNPLLSFGWDIRPNKKSDWWLLRTNLRYSPFLKINYQNRTMSLQQLEFNFIQFVFYPQRLKRYINLSKEYLESIF